MRELVDADSASVPAAWTGGDDPNNAKPPRPNTASFVDINYNISRGKRKQVGTTGNVTHPLQYT